jgi:diaminopimelate epimerase
MRCCAKYVYDHGLTDQTDLTFETRAGIIKPKLTVEDGTVTSVTVDMGEPRLARRDIPMEGEPADEPVIDEVLDAEGEMVRVTCVSMGNPHCIQFVESVEEAPVLTTGPKIEYHPKFPDRTNVEFIEIIDREHVKMRVWERGAGETLACGTGASATGVACVLNDLTERSIQVELLGGTLQIEWHENNHVFMAGPAAEIYSGEMTETFIAPAMI